MAITLILLVALVLATFLKPAKERAFEEKLKTRSELNDETFYERFYGGTDIPKAIPIRLRRLYAEQLGGDWGKVFPPDNPALVYVDLDFADLLICVGDAFGVSVPLEEMRRLDGSFDSVVKYLAKQVEQLSSR